MRAKSGRKEEHLGNENRGDTMLVSVSRIHQHEEHEDVTDSVRDSEEKISILQLDALFFSFDEQFSFPFHSCVKISKRGLD